MSVGVRSKGRGEGATLQNSRMPGDSRPLADGGPVPFGETRDGSVLRMLDAQMNGTQLELSNWPAGFSSSDRRAPWAAWEARHLPRDPDFASCRGDLGFASSSRRL